MNEFSKPQHPPGYAEATASKQGTKARVRFSFFVFLCLSMLLGSGSRGLADDSQVIPEETVFCLTASSEARTSGERILMGQVAEISGGSQALRQEVSSIDLGPAPRPGEERRIAGSMIASALASFGGLPANSRTSIPEWVSVKGVSQSLSEVSLAKVFKQYVSRSVGGDEVIVSRVRIRGMKPLPPGKVTLTPAGNSNTQLKGRTSLRLAVAVDGKDYGLLTVSGWVDRYAQVVCAARQISRGTVLSPDDVCLKRINVAKAPDRLVLNSAQVLGKQARSDIQVGEYVRQNQLITVPLIVKGDMVKLLVSAGQVRVSTLGIAKTNGDSGDQIRVENVASKKTLIGRVLDASTVEVLF